MQHTVIWIILILDFKCSIESGHFRKVEIWKDISLPVHAIMHVPNLEKNKLI